MKVITVVGTRPEAIKMAPVILALKVDPFFHSLVVSTGQHQLLLDVVLKDFGIIPDHNLNVMANNQTLAGLTQKLICELTKVYDAVKPDLILVHGDTTTAFVGALAGFYLGIKVAHVEAGLRTYNLKAPFPEELNRQLVSKIAEIHFAPTEIAKQNLIQEGIAQKSVFVTGNTVVDALLNMKERVYSNEDELEKIGSSFSFLNDQLPLILVTGHRRENFGESFQEICFALKEIAENNSVQIIYPVHLNPQVQKPVYSILNDVKNVFLVDPVGYKEIIYLMEKSKIILTDSGGIQEEAPSFKKPVVVMREVTERAEGLNQNISLLTGANKEKIVSTVSNLLNNKTDYLEAVPSQNPYGDGKASERILNILKR